MRAKKTLILGSMLLAVALAGCRTVKLDEETIDDLSTKIAGKLDIGDEFVETVGDELVEKVEAAAGKKVNTTLVKEVLDTVVEEHEEWAPIPISEASGSWKVWRNRIESRQMTEAECKDLRGCEVQLGTCQTPVEDVTSFTVVELKPTGDQAEFSVEDPQYDVEEDPGVTIENNTVTISNKFIAVHDDLCKDLVGTTGLKECEVWEMVTQHTLILAAYEVCTVTVTIDAEEVFASGDDDLEEAEQELKECQSSQEGEEGQGEGCSFQAEVTFKAGTLECLAQTDKLDKYKEWLKQDAGYEMYVDRGGVPRRAKVPGEVGCE